MLTDWIHWLCSRHPDQLLSFLWILLIVDGPRYALSRIIMVCWDAAHDLWRWVRPTPAQPPYPYCPSVCAVVAGYNESEIIESTLASIWGTYPRLKIVVVDDGSTDDMGDKARRFAHTHPGVLVLSRSERGGRQGAMNFALAYARDVDVIVFVDSDSELAPETAIWEIVQPLIDPLVGAVGGSILANNAFTNLLTWFQAYEYFNTIYVGRLLLARLGLLPIVSGAFGAYRRTVLEQLMGPDTEAGEDMDLTLRVRKAGYKIAFAQQSICYTEVPYTLKSLLKQRIFWEGSGVVRLLCRKHIDMAYFWTANFRWSNFIIQFEQWFFNVFCVVSLWCYNLWFWTHVNADDRWYMIISIYIIYIIIEMVQVISILFYSTNLRRDALICLVAPIVPFYQLMLFFARSWAMVAEILYRTSYRHNFIPKRVREASWWW